MSTPIEIIYSKFLNKIDDIELSMIEDEELEEILIDYLENSTLEFFECEKDLTIVKPYKEELVLKCDKESYESDIDFGLKKIYQIDTISNNDNIDEDFTNGIFHTWKINISRKEFNEFEIYYLQEIIDPNFSVDDNGEINNTIADNTIEGIDYEKIPLEEGIDYKLYFNEEENALYIFSLKEFSSEDFLYFINNSKGYIKDDLDLDEIHILAYGMLMSWISPKIRREENLRQMMNDRDFSQLSIANMLGKLIDLSKHTKSELFRYKQRYAYKNFKGFN